MENKTDTTETIEAAINRIITELDNNVDTEIISDGYHTFGELYEHRITLYIALCFVVELQYNFSRKRAVWKSRIHHDGSEWKGWFIMGMFTDPGKQITYHLPEKYWDECPFAEELDRAPEWDHHSSEDVLERLQKLFFNKA